MALTRRTCARPCASGEFPYVLSRHVAPLRRKTTTYGEDMQRGKEHNVARVARAIEGTVVEPFAVFSYHALVGKPTKARGFLPGPEMQRGRLVAGVGGGACSVSNTLYWLAIQAGMRIVERHRHGLDLFPDHGRTVPFACGATVFYNQSDLRFENPLPCAVRVSLVIEGEALVGLICASRDPGYRFEIVERDHRFWEEGGKTFRENRVWRRVLRADGSLVLEELLAHNRAQVLYDVRSEEPL
jgi:vancomycin resistance protein VanW